MKAPSLPRINPIVLIMIYADFVMTFGAGFLAPVFAVYLTTQIEGGSLAMVGFSTTLFWVVKSLVQMPVSIMADQKKGEQDDFRFIVAGSTIFAATPLLFFFFASEPWHVYLIQIIDGIGYGLFTPPWLATFTRHIDKNHENVEWTIHSNVIGLAFAVAAAVGGVLADRFGIRIIFPMVSVAMYVGVILLLSIRKHLDGEPIGRSLKDTITLQRSQESIVRQ